jgi:hypothetical protein
VIDALDDAGVNAYIDSIVKQAGKMTSDCQLLPRLMH